MDITVIIPAYNRIWSLPKAIESCKSAGELAVQIIVVDDGSTDGTWEMLEQTQGIEIYRQQHWGKPWAINMAFDRAKGKYVKFLDSDDWLIAGSLLKEFNLAEQQNADLIVAGYEIYEDEKFIRKQDWINCDDFIAQNLGECDSSHYSAFLFKKDFIEDIPHRTSFASANFASRDDRCFMLEVALKEPKIAVLNEPALCHSHHQKGRLQFQNDVTSVCTNYQHLLIYKNILKQLADTNQLNVRRIKASTNVLWHLANWMARNMPNEAIKIVNWIYELDPEFKISQKGILGFLFKNAGISNTYKLLKFKNILFKK